MRWTGFLVGLLALSLWGCPSAAEREQRAAERAKKEAAKADEALEQLTAVAAALPARSALREAACPAGTDARTLGYVPVDVDYLRQFKASGFEPMKDLPTYRKYFAQEKDYTGVWFRDTDWSQLQAGIQADPRGDHTIAHAWFEVLWTSSKPGDGLKEAPNGHLAVIYTSREKLPAISNYPGKGDVILDPAEFSGWVVLVEPQSGHGVVPGSLPGGQLRARFLHPRRGSVGGSV